MSIWVGPGDHSRHTQGEASVQWAAWRQQECLSYWLLPSWEASLDSGERNKAHCSVDLWLRLARTAQCSWELGRLWAALTSWALLPFPCRRSQERVSVHPHRLHPSFDFGHQLQTPQPRYLAEGTDW